MQLLIHPMLDQLGQLGLSGMAQAFAELEASNGTPSLATRLMPTPSLTGSFTTPTVSISLATA
jgi:hypothetical protein